MSTNLSISSPESPFSIINEGLISVETFNDVYNAMRYIYYPVLFLGFVLGFFSVVVYSSPRMRSPTSVLLVALNLAEMGCVFVIALFRIFSPENIGRGDFNSLMIMLYASIYLKIALRRSTYCYSCLVSIERCIAVVFPLRAKHLRLIRYPLAVVILTLVASLVGTVNLALKYEVKSYEDTVTNKTVWGLRLSPLYLRNKSIFFAANDAGRILFVYLPLGICLIANTITSVSLRRHQLRRQKLFEARSAETSNEAKEKNTTIVVLVSTFVLVFLALPINISATITTSANTEFGSLRREHYLYQLVLTVCDFLEFLINCTGFIFYMTIGVQFRRTFLGIFCKICMKKIGKGKYRGDQFSKSASSVEAISNDSGCTQSTSTLNNVPSG